MTQNSSDSRFTRFRRWLGYKILPGTTGFQVRTGRALALHELSFSFMNAENGATERHIAEAYHQLKDKIPVPEEHDISYELEEESEWYRDVNDISTGDD